MIGCLISSIELAPFSKEGFPIEFEFLLTCEVTF